MSRTLPILDLLAHWQAFSQLQQRAFEFLAAEAVSTGLEFENSTEGATAVLLGLSQRNADTDTSLHAQTNAVVHRLQAADRSRQGLEQVASVLTTLRRQHAELEEITRRCAEPPPVDGAVAQWIEALSQNISLTDWRRRFIDVLEGRGPAEATSCDDDDMELF